MPHADESTRCVDDILPDMTLVDLMDETFVVCEPAVLAARIHDTNMWRTWWPELELTVFKDRGNRGIRWFITGALEGSCEIWLETFADGVVVHYYLRADPPMLQQMRDRHRLGERLRREHARRWKKQVNALKDEVEGNRAPGHSRVTPALS